MLQLLYNTQSHPTDRQKRILIFLSVLNNSKMFQMKRLCDFSRYVPENLDAMTQNVLNHSIEFTKKMTLDHRRQLTKILEMINCELRDLYGLPLLPLKPSLNIARMRSSYYDHTLDSKQDEIRQKVNHLIYFYDYLNHFQ